jgi:SAM-dependent methyltransferase
VTDRPDPGAPSAAWDRWRRWVDVGAYDERWAAMERDGVNPHGEADLVMRFEPRSVLDGGCGTGRLGVELARRGVEVVGVDLDPEMIAAARAKAPDIEWHLASLAGLDLGRTFDVVALAGNVIPFVEPDLRRDAVAGCSRHVAPHGALVMGASLRPGWPATDDIDEWCEAAGLVLVDRWATWDGAPFTADANYAVSVHRRRDLVPPAPGAP